MDDCLPDAIQQRMAQAILRASDGAPADAPLVVLSSSLGSKILFDTLLRMDLAAQRTIDRMAYLVMTANQIPLLALADQQVEDGRAAAALPPADSLHALLRKRRAPAAPRSNGPALTLVAFSDPNDLAWAAGAPRPRARQLPAQPRRCPNGRVWPAS